MISDQHRNSALYELSIDKNLHPLGGKAGSGNAVDSLADRLVMEGIVGLDREICVWIVRHHLLKRFRNFFCRTQLHAIQIDVDIV